MHQHNVWKVPVWEFVFCLASDWSHNSPRTSVLSDISVHSLSFPRLCEFWSRFIKHFTDFTCNRSLPKICFAFCLSTQLLSVLFPVPLPLHTGPHFTGEAYISVLWHLLMKVYQCLCVISNDLKFIKLIFDDTFNCVTGLNLLPVAQLVFLVCLCNHFYFLRSLWSRRRNAMI